MRFVSLLICAAALAAAAPGSNQEAPIFRTGVALVHVDAEVTQDGRTLTGFTKDDFRVFDERKEQPVLHFSADQEPLDLILLFDVSGSMGAVVANIAAATRQGLRELRPGDRVCVMVFNSRSREVAPFTEDLDAVERTIHDQVLGSRFGGGTLIQSAVDAAALKFMDQPRNQRRRAVLIITDNMGMRTRREQSVVRDFWEADALLSGLIVGNPVFRTLHTVGIVLGPQNLLMQAGMKGIAAKTGGDAISSDDAGPAFQDAMHRIRSRYSLYYAQPQAKPGATRSIRVELANSAAQRFPKAKVRSRTGYIVPSN